ncbi:MAG: heavy metal-associated domain-containing protein [Ottowia sp.]
MARVEKALKKVPGVDSAAVNLATESARVQFAGDPRGSGPAAAPRRARCRLRAARRRGRAGRGRRRALGRFCAGGHRPAAVGAAGAADAGHAVGLALDAAGLGAVLAGHAGAVLAGGALLPRRLACAEGAQRQHGAAGVDRHHGGLAAVDVAVAGQVAPAGA